MLAVPVKGEFKRIPVYEADVLSRNLEGERVRHRNNFCDSGLDAAKKNLLELAEKKSDVIKMEQRRDK